MMFLRGIGSYGLFCRGFGFSYPGVWLGLAAVFVAALVVVIVLSVKKSRRGAKDATAEALKLRYVKGELTTEEYQKMKDVIGK